MHKWLPHKAKRPSHVAVTEGAAYVKGVIIGSQVQDRLYPRLCSSCIRISAICCALDVSPIVVDVFGPNPSWKTSKESVCSSLNAAQHQPSELRGVQARTDTSHKPAYQYQAQPPEGLCQRTHMCISPPHTLMSKMFEGVSTQHGLPPAARTAHHLQPPLPCRPAQS